MYFEGTVVEILNNNMLESAKALFRGIFFILKPYIRKEERVKMNFRVVPF